MLHIILAIIKFILLLLAILLGLVLLAVLLVLFVPLRYRGTASFQGTLSAEGSVTWLWRVLSVRASYLEGRPQFTVKLLWFTLAGGEKKPPGKGKSPGKKQKRGSAREKPEEISADEAGEGIKRQAPADSAGGENDVNLADGKDADRPEKEKEPRQTCGEGMAEDAPLEDDEESARIGPAGAGFSRDLSGERSEEAGEAPVPGGQKVSLPRRIAESLRALAVRVRSAFKALGEKLRHMRESVAELKAKVEAYKRLWRDEHTQQAVRHVKKELGYLARHWRPRRLEGSVKIGLEDPADTGQLLGILCILQAFSGNCFLAEADFEQKVFEGRAFLRGRVRLCHLAKAALALFADRHVRVTVARVRRMREI